VTEADAVFAQPPAEVHIFIVDAGWKIQIKLSCFADQVSVAKAGVL
jgi:hypothetical protein